MFLIGLLLAVADPASGDGIKISPDVQDIVKKHGDGFGPAAETELRSLSKLGDASASALLGELLMMRNRAGGSDFAGSCDYSEKAGQFSSALHNLATCYFLGSGRAKDMAKARELYRRAADLGYPKSKCAFGNMLVHGQGGPAEVGRGVELCRQAADTGLPDAQTDYAGYLLTGKYGPKDAGKARTYLLPAAEKGHANAAFLLGQIYWNGDGVDKNVSEAARWWLVSYNGGRMDAATLLGRATLAEILPGLKDKRPIRVGALKEAERWFGIAAEKDPDPEQRRRAAEMLKNLKEISVRSN